MFRSCLALCGLFFATAAYGTLDQVADRIYYGGDIITVDDSNPFPEAIAVGDGRILGVGDLSRIVRLRGADTDLVDLDGRTLVPGFIDAHSHLSRVGLQAIAANLMRPPDGGPRTISDIRATLRRWAEDSSPVREFGLVIGYGFDESQLTDRRWLTRHDLDAVSSDLPVIAIHRSGRLSVLNGRALELAGIRAETPELPGGTIHRWIETDEPNGVLTGNAHYTALHRILSQLIEKKFDALIDASQQLYARFGHTTAQDSRPDPAALSLYPRMAADGRLIIDVIAYPDLVADAENPILNSRFRSSDYTNGFRVGGVMLRLKGTLRPETARLRQSYLRLASGALNGFGGIATFEDEDAAALVTRAFRKDWPVMAFASGEGAMDQFIKAVRTAATAVPGRTRHPVIIQGQALGPQRLGAIEQLGILPSLFHPSSRRKSGLPAHYAAAGRDPKDAPMLSWLTARQIRFTVFHDAPATLPDVMRVFAAAAAAVETNSASFQSGYGMTRMATLKALTLWAAYQYFENDRKGSITEGKLADLVLLSGNPLTADLRDIAKIRVEETIKEGETVFLRPNPEEGGKAKVFPPSHACADAPVCFEGMTAALNRAGLAGEQGQKPSRPGRSAGLSR